MTMTLDSVPAKLNELDLRAPLEVFEAIEAAIREHADLWSKWQAERCFRAKAEAELAAARETIKRLNRRVQVAEAGIAEKVKASAPGSLGRALANAAADKYMRERDMAQAELAALKARIEGAPSVVLCYAGGHWHDAPYAVMAQARVPDDSWCNKRVRLLVEE